MTVFYFFLTVSVSFLTSCTSLLFYLGAPSGWLCESGEAPGEEYLPEHRCPRRKTALFLMTAVTTFVLTVSGGIQSEAPDSEIYRLLFLLITAGLLYPAALCDVDYCIIPDQSCLITLLAAFLKGIHDSGLTGAGIAAGGGMLCGCMMLLAALLARLASGKQGIGMGDIKLLAACGALTASAAESGPWFSAACSVYIFSVLSSAVWFSVLLLCRQAQYGEGRPLGPWIVLGTLLIIAIW